MCSCQKDLCPTETYPYMAITCQIKDSIYLISGHLGCIDKDSQKSQLQIIGVHF